MPGLIIHGGAGRPRPRKQRDAIAEVLIHIARSAWDQLCDGGTAMEVAVTAAKALEDNPLFNAGLGSKLQADGGARLSASLMDGTLERFSGVVNVEGLLNPIELALALQAEQDRVLSGAGALQHARALGLAEGDVRTTESIENWHRSVSGETGTIGAIVLTTKDALRPRPVPVDGEWRKRIGSAIRAPSLAITPHPSRESAALEWVKTSSMAPWGPAWCSQSKPGAPSSRPQTVSWIAWSRRSGGRA